MQDSSAGLARDLGRWQLLAITVGAVVGASIYLRPAMVAQALGTPWRILLAWTVAGAISLAGALSYAQLAARWPRAGGEYVYLGETMGEPAAFLFGWMRITVGVAAAAGQATAVIVFLADLLPVGSPWAHWTISALGVPLAVAIGPRQLLAVLVIAALAFLNCLGVGKAGHFQAALTVLKVAALLCVVAILLSAARPATSTAASYSLAAPGANGWSTALLGAITAFNGWTLAAMLGGETRDAERAVPWALCWGMAIATVCYLAANLGYLAALPVATLAGGQSALHPYAPSAASLAVSAAAGPHASGWVSALLALSTLGALHVQLLSVPRVFFAMAHDRLLPAVFGRVHPATRAPVATIVTFAAIACVLALLGNFDLLMNMAGFGYLVFYALTVLGLLRILLQQPHASQSRRIGRLAVAVVFLAGTSWLLVRIIASAHAEIIAALVLMAAGLPAYLLAQRLRRSGGAQAAFTR